MFLALVLLPYVGLHVGALVDWLRAPIWLSQATITLQGLALAGVLGALVYLARPDVLHSREIHADLAAAVERRPARLVGPPGGPWVASAARRLVC